MLKEGHENSTLNMYTYLQIGDFLEFLTAHAKKGLPQHTQASNLTGMP